MIHPDAPTHLQQLNETHYQSVIFRGIAGSHAYGTAKSDSDTDIRGIYVLRANAYLGLTSPVEQLSDERNDTTYYALRRFFELAAAANPNIIELLYLPQDCLIFRLFKGICG